MNAFYRRWRLFSEMTLPDELYVYMIRLGSKGK